VQAIASAGHGDHTSSLCVISQSPQSHLGLLATFVLVQRLGGGNLDDQVVRTATQDRQTRSHSPSQ